jgi:hypothetical protein
VDLAARHREMLLAEFGPLRRQAEAAIGLFDQDATLPFIARYRKERTGGLTETQLQEIADRREFYAALVARKRTALDSIAEQGRLTPELEREIVDCLDKQRLEDLYLPPKPKRRTRAQAAREKGYEPLADRIWAHQPASGDADAMAGARDIEHALSSEGLLRCHAFPAPPRPLSRRRVCAPLACCGIVLFGGKWVMSSPTAFPVVDRIARRLVGRSLAPVHELIARAGPSDADVLILGSNGAGKEVVARLLMELSPRRGPHVPIDCAALAESLVDSELFGHEASAFTGAGQSRKIGLFEKADRGQVFLDEVGAASPAVQKKLLRVLQERTLRRVGGLEDVPVDFRVVAATNADLEAEIVKGAFRRDLCARLAGTLIRIPPLAERRADIPELVSHFLERHATPRGKPALSKEAQDVFQAYPWPGNVRELERVIESLSRNYAGERVGVAELATTSLGEWLGASRAWRTVASTDQRLRIVSALRASGGIVAKAAAALGMHRVSVHRMIRRMKIQPCEWRRPSKV